MTKLVTDDLSPEKSAGATGHPSECTEPAPGVVEGTTHSVTVNDAAGNEKPIATKNSTLHFDSHSHDYDGTCHDDESHDISGSDFNDSKLSSSININGFPVIVIADDVATDPKTNDPINVTGSGINNSLSETP